MRPDPELIEAIATDLGVDPSFVEKDWYAVRLVATVAGVRDGSLTPVFSGGTSLSKGYGLIRRFSEDLIEVRRREPTVSAVELQHRMDRKRGGGGN